MVRSDLMWAIDQSLRVNRGRPREPFGGVRLAMFGDLHQLPPVIDEAEVAAHLETEHGGPFFFSHRGAARGRRHRADRAHPGLPPEGRGAARACSTACATATRTRTTSPFSTSACIPIRTLAEGEPYVILTPTNAAARRINMAYLEALPGRRARVPGRRDRRVQRERPAHRRNAGAEARRQGHAAAQRPRPALGQRHHRPRVAARGRPRVGRGRRRGARDRAGRLGEPALRLRQGGGEDRRDGGRHLPAVPAAAGLGADHPQEPGPDARQGVHRPRARHLRPRPGLRGAVALPHARRAWRSRGRCGPPTSCSIASAMGYRQVFEHLG